MKNYVLPLTVLLLSMSIFYAGFQLKNVVVNFDNQEQQPNHEDGKEEKIEKGLLTLEETAEYLRISAEELDRMTRDQTIERNQRNSYSTFDYLPFMTINGERFFQKEIIDQWIEQNILRWYQVKVTKISGAML